MWKIAKETIRLCKISLMNELSGTQMKTGEKLLIVKAVSSVKLTKNLADAGKV